VLYDKQDVAVIHISYS